MTPPQTDSATGDLAGFIDHTLLKAEATPAMIVKLCDQALAHGFRAVCINSGWVSAAARQLRGSRVSVCSVIGFPLGAVPSAVKALEAELACAAGAHELDMVMQVGALKDGRFARVAADIESVRKACGADTLLKVIIETALLTRDEITTACKIACQASADFVKTSTGFAGGGATPADVSLMRSVVGPRVGVKASGGIKDAPAARAMIRAGANRIGTSSGVAILQSDGGPNAPHRTPNEATKEIP